jgi:hypothetical protein
MKHYVIAKFDVSHLEPKHPEHLKYVIGEYLRKKGVENYQLEVKEEK